MEYIALLEEAKKYDHRELRKKQELFLSIHVGSCFFLPHGTRITEKLKTFIRTDYRKRGYQESDKSKIKLVIEVDAKKKEILQATWGKATLLPGTMTKLEQPEGRSCFDGVRVACGIRGVLTWSLSELSGGQRSLLSLF
ncbi:threonine--tRNA ligase, mitochondrial 1-like protein [Tanacetum coccineum]